MTFTIPNFPLPPTTNKLFAFAKTYNRMVKTKTYRAYDKAVQFWVLSNPGQINDLRAFFRGLAPNVIHIDAIFYMKKGSIICKDGRPKCNDTSNRIKALHDVLSTIIGVDDSYFWSGSFEKIAVDENEYVEIKLTIRQIS